MPSLGSSAIWYRNTGSWYLIGAAFSFGGHSWPVVVTISIRMVLQKLIMLLFAKHQKGHFKRDVCLLKKSYLASQTKSNEPNTCPMFIMLWHSASWLVVGNCMWVVLSFSPWLMLCLHVIGFCIQNCALWHLWRALARQEESETKKLVDKHKLKQRQICWMKRSVLLWKQISSLEILVVWSLLPVAAACSGFWSGNFKDATVADAHIFQHTPAEMGMESCLRTVLHAFTGWIRCTPVNQKHNKSSSIALCHLTSFSICEKFQAAFPPPLLTLSLSSDPPRLDSSLSRTVLQFLDMCPNWLQRWT